MNIKVFQDRKIEKDYFYNEGSQNENNSTVLTFEIPFGYEDYSKRIVFMTEEGNYWDYIKENSYTIKNNITKYENIEAYLWLTKDDNDFRTETFPLNFYQNENPDELVPTEEQVDGFATIIKILEEKIDEVEALKIDIGDFKKALEDKVDKEDGKGLSTNDFTNELKDKLDKLKNYDDAEIREILDGNLKDVNYKASTGIMTFIKNDESKIEIDLPLELLIEDGRYDETTKQIILTLANGNVINIPLSDLIDDFYTTEKVNELLQEKQTEIDRLTAENEAQAEQISYLDKTLTRAEATGENINIKNSAEYPISNISIDTNIKQDSRDGYNLLNLRNATTTNYGVTTSYENENINSNGTSTASWFDMPDIYNLVVNLGELVNFIPNELYTLWRSDTKYILNLRITYTDDTKTDVRINAGSNIATFSVEDKEIKRIHYFVTGHTTGDTISIKDLKTMILKGSYTSTTIPPYEQYGSMPSIEFPSEIKTPVGKQSLVVGNKNLFDIIKYPIIKKVAFTSVGELVWWSNYCGIQEYLPILPNTNYMFSSDVKDVLYRVVFYDASKNYISNTSINIKSFTTPNECKYIRLSINSDVLPTWIQIEEGETVTAYTPHQNQVQDLDLTSELLGKIYKKDGKWVKLKQWNERIFNGSENWIMYNRLVYIDIDDILSLGSGVNSNFYTNYFKFGGGKIYIGHTTGKRLHIGLDNVGLTDITTVALWKEWLSTHNLQFVYQCEPIEEEITDETLLAQLNAIDKMHTYEGVTNIYTINENGISPVINLEYTTKYAEEYDFYIDENARFIVPEYGINYQVSMTESDLSDMPEASESAVKIAGKDGDVVLNTTYEPKYFNIVAYTDDNLEPKDKETEKTKLVNFLHSIKNRTKNFGLLYREKFYPVKYNDKLTPTIYPKSIRFEIPIKSSKSLGYALEKKMIFGNGKEISNTIEETGCKIIIEGPIYGTNDSPMVITLNDYQMAYYNTVLEGNRLEIDTNNSTIKHISSNGEVTNVAAYYNHEYPKIKYGENEIKILSKIDSETQVYTEWYDLKI